MDLGTTTHFLSGNDPPRKSHPFLMYTSIQGTADVLAQCLDADHRRVIAGIAAEFSRREIDQVLITGCGTSYNAGKVLLPIFERLTGLPTRLYDSLEFRLYPPPGLGSRAALIAISHSGNTLPTNQAVQAARQAGAYTLGLVGNPAGSLVTYAHTALQDPGGEELPRPKTRSFTVTCFQGLQIAAAVHGGQHALAELQAELDAFPDLIRQVSTVTEDAVRSALGDWGAVRHCLVAGAGPAGGCALEIALKMMETCGIPATGFELEEFTHGPGYCLSTEGGVLLLQSRPESLPRALQAAAAVRATGARLAIITAQPQANWVDGARIIALPPAGEYTGPLATALPAQYLVYFLALDRGRNPDVAMNDRVEIQNLAKLMFPPGTH